MHTLSLRRDRPFVAVNCGAMPEALLESELFGHVRGAFTGADKDKKGLIEAADGGTVFLDEIGEMAPTMQVKLLRVLQERKYRRVGGTEESSSNIRVIAATNRELPKLVGEGKFREDLFYRLNVIPVKMPPLRERAEDIPLIAEHFLAKYTREMNKTIDGFSPEALAALRAYPWPGNVRELENIVERRWRSNLDGASSSATLPDESARRPSAPRRGRASGDRRDRRWIQSRTPSAGHRALAPRARARTRRRRADPRCRRARPQLPPVPLLDEEARPEARMTLRQAQGHPERSRGLTGRRGSVALAAVMRSWRPSTCCGSTATPA